MRLFGKFFSGAQSKLKQPLLSINSDESIEIKIDRETKHRM